MDNQFKTPEERKAERLKLAKRQRTIRAAAILLAILLSLISLIQSCSTKKAIEDLAAQIAAKKAAQAAQLLEAETETEEIPLDVFAAPAPVSGNNTITLSFVGDCILASYEGCEDAFPFERCYELNGASYFFENVKSIFEGDDLTIANLECSLATSTNRVEKSRTFQGDPSYVEILTSGGIDAVNIANDHAHDYGDEGHVDTLANLDNADIFRFGNGYTKILEADGIQVGFLGVDETDLGASGTLEALNEDIQALRDEGAQIIIASFHWGEEGATAPDDATVSLAHAAVDAGADLVIGHHAGILQGIEYYQGKYICYSLGSFLYGAETSVKDMDTMIFQVELSLNKDTVTTENYYIIPCSVASTATNDYCPTPLTGDEAQRVLDKIYALSGALDGGIVQEAE